MKLHDMIQLPETERQLAAILTECVPWIPAEQLSDMRELVEAGEPGVALENLCVQLFEFDAVIPPGVKQRIQDVGTRMRIKPSYWERLPTAPSNGGPQG